MDEQDNYQFIGENFRGKEQQLTIKVIALRQIQKIVNAGSVEFVGGYKKKIIHGDYIFEEYVPDTREVYINSILMLRDLLHPYFDNDISAYDKKVQDEMLEIETEDITKAHRKKKVEAHRNLFVEMCDFIKRNKTFDDVDLESEII